jgi:hypothetical protein
MGSATIWESGEDKFRFQDGSNTYEFIADNSDVIEIKRDGENNTVIAFQGHGTIHSNGDVRIYLDKNQEAQPSAARLKVFNGSNFEVFSINEQGEVDFHLGGGRLGGITTRKVTLAGATGTDEIVTVGTGLPEQSAGRGRVAIRNQAELTDQEFGARPKKAGILVLYDEGGRENFLWVDSSGKLRISRNDPGANDLSGTIVGTQS